MRRVLVLLLAGFVARVKAQTGASQVDIVNLASLAGANHGTTSAGACLIFVTCQQAYTSMVLSGATNTCVACANHLTYPTDTSIPSQVRAFASG